MKKLGIFLLLISTTIVFTGCTKLDNYDTVKSDATIVKHLTVPNGQRFISELKFENENNFDVNVFFTKDWKDKVYSGKLKTTIEPDGLIKTVGEYTNGRKIVITQDGSITTINETGPDGTKKTVQLVQVKDTHGQKIEKMKFDDGRIETRKM